MPLVWLRLNPLNPSGWTLSTAIRDDRGFIWLPECEKPWISGLFRWIILICHLKAPWRFIVNKGSHRSYLWEIWCNRKATNDTEVRDDGDHENKGRCTIRLKGKEDVSLTMSPALIVRHVEIHTGYHILPFCSKQFQHSGLWFKVNWSK